MNTDSTLFANLKSSNYEKVIKYIDEIEKQNKDVALEEKSLYTEDEYLEHLKDIDKDLSSLYNIRQAIIEEDTKFINDLLLEIENDTKTSCPHMDLF